MGKRFEVKLLLEKMLELRWWQFAAAILVVVGGGGDAGG